MALTRVLEALEAHGLLLESDPWLPTVASLVAGGPVKGSWWGHPEGRAIFAVSRSLAIHPDAVSTRLVSGKITWVHRRLWPALLGAARSRESWQTRGLDRNARAILKRVTQAGTLRSDRDRLDSKSCLTLERRLLVHGGTLHTERGAHARVLESWDRWALRSGITGRRVSAARARDALDRALGAIRERYGGKGVLPWEV